MPSRSAALPQQQWIPNRVRRRDQQQTSRVLGERLKASNEALFDPSRKRVRPQHPEPTGQLCRRQPARQFEQSEWIPACLGDDPVAHSLVRHESHGRAQQRAGVAIVQPAHHQVRKLPKLLPHVARTEHDPDRLGQKPPRDKREVQRRCLVEPLRVVDNTQQRTLLGSVREQTQHSQPHEKPVRGWTRAKPEDDLQGLALGSRQPPESIKERRTQLVQMGISQLHLRLHPHSAQHGQARR